MTQPGTTSVFCIKGKNKPLTWCQANSQRIVEETEQKDKKSFFFKLTSIIFKKLIRRIMIQIIRITVLWGNTRVLSMHNAKKEQEG